MANKNDYRELSQVDYCLQQYYSKYMASALVNERTEIYKEQSKASEKLYESQQRLPNFGAASNPFTKLNDSEQLTKKSMDDLAERTMNRWFKNKNLEKDYGVLVTSFYQALVAKNGGKESQALWAYSNNYCLSRLQKLMVEQLAREKVPRNTAEYIAKKAFSESIFGLGNFSKLKKGEMGASVDEKTEKIYNPSTASKIAGTLGGYAIDAVVMPGGVGKGASSASKAALKAGKKVAGWGATDLTLKGGVYAIGKIWGKDEEKEANRKFFGDENASQKIEDGANRYKKNGTEFITVLNSNLKQKIKVPPLSIPEKAHKDANVLYAKNGGSAKKLLTSISQGFSKQAVPYNGNSKVPGWMLKYGSKTNQGYAAKFYAIAMEMSRNRKESMKVGGKTMTLKEVAQRAYDYARAATVAEQRQTAQTRRSSFSSTSQKAIDSYDANMAALNAAIEGKPTTKKRKATQQTPQATASSMMQNSGWGNALESLGLNGFGDISKNLGYVLAMLPDMIIGMFTGRTPNFKLQDNLMPLAAIVGGMFVRNPLLKMMLMGFGGANILNKAGHAAINEGLARSNSKTVTTYKSYDNESLNPRIQNPAMKGCSMIATIDGVPSVINISKDAADAYAKGAIPINTLANAVLKKYDENHALASQNYDQHVNQQEESTHRLVIK